MTALDIKIVASSESICAKVAKRLEAGIPAGMKAVAAQLEAHVADNFRGQHAPDGSPWAPHSPYTLALRAMGGFATLRRGPTLARLTGAARRFDRAGNKARNRIIEKTVAGAKLLVDKGTLRNSFVSQASGKSASLTVGGPASKYAHVHQMGNPKNRLPNRARGARAPIPARPFMPLGVQGGRLVPMLPPKLREAIKQTIRDAILRGL